MTAPEIVGDRLRVTFGAPSEAHVPGWWKCPSCKRRAYSPGDPSACQCATCGEALEPILQPERGERERTPASVLVSEVEG